MNKFMFIVLALFGFNAVADMQSGMDNMSGMMNDVESVVGDKEEDEGFIGSFSLRYKPFGFNEVADEVSYRARVGWKGYVNDMVKWGVVLSTDTESNFSTNGLTNVNLEQAYVKYSPIEGLSVKAGKMGWMSDFHKKGILVSEQIYQEGVVLKYKYEMENDNKAYVKLGAYKLDGEEANAPLAEGVTLKGKLGGSWNVYNLMAQVYVMGLYDGVLKSDKEAEVAEVAEAEVKEAEVKEAEAKTLAQAGLNISSNAMALPVGVFGHYLSDATSLTEDVSYTAGVFVGKSGSGDSVEMGDFGVAISYYAVATDDYRINWLNEDYVAGAGKGIAARAQYNPWDNVSVVVKYAHNLDADKGVDANNLLGELMFVF